MIAFAVSVILAASAGPADARESGEKPADKPAVAVWVLSYERLDGNALADPQFLPKFIDPALTKLKDKGAKKVAFDFDQRQVAVWFEGKQTAALKDVQGAFPGLVLKLVAKAVFPADQ
jgi:hypothetical protein